MPVRFLFSLAVLSGIALLGCGGTVVVDSDGEVGGDPGDVVTPQPTQPVPPEVGCRMRLEPVYDGGALQISEDGLSASAWGGSELVRGSASHAGGRWYFEIRVDSMPGGVWWAQNIGIGTESAISSGMGDPAGMGAFLNVNGSLSYPDPETPFSGEPYGAGDVIGVAADLDAGLVFFSRNGVWMNGADPSSGSGGVAVAVAPGTGTYYPAVGLSEGDAVTAAFEGAFAFGPPSGFAPFAAGLEADAGGACVDPGPQGIPSTPAPIQATCASGDFSSYGAPVSGGAELHVIGMYQPSAPGGTVSVHVERQGDIVLALATYSAASFQVTAGPGASISRIVLSSYEPSSVSAPAGVPVDSHVFEVNGSWLDTGYAWPNAPGGTDTQALVEAVESITGRELTSFGGCYAGSAFTLTD